MTSETGEVEEETRKREDADNLSEEEEERGGVAGLIKAFPL